MSINEIILCVAGVLITIIPIVREVKLRNRQELKKKIIYIIFLILTSLIILYTSIRKISTDSDDKAKTDSIANALSIKLGDQKLLIKNLNDSLTKKMALDKEFQNSLKNDFKIIRDSISNKPKKLVNLYNTNIDYADKVNIGSH